MKIVAFLIIFPFVSFGQKENKLSFEFGVSKNKFSMDSLNQFYIDSFALKNALVGKRISKGTNFSLGIKYKPYTLFDIGLYSNYQFDQARGYPVFILTDQIGTQIGTQQHDFKLKTEAISVGVSSCIYISKFLKFQEKENQFLKRSHLGLELNAGIGFSKVSIDYRNPYNNNASQYFYHKSQDFHGQIALKFEYDFIQSPIIGSVGIRVGYQSLSTKTLKDRIGTEWIVNGKHPMNLNFSGVFAGVFFSIGK